MISKEILIDFKPTKDFFIGIDSDGCVFDTMEIKHKECFCPAFIKHWSLQPVSKYVREAWEFVNLYSVYRGSNRFLAVIEVLKLLHKRREILKRKFKLPSYNSLIDWTGKESQLGNHMLEKYVRKTSDPNLKIALQWSKAVNLAIEEIVYGIPPFPGVLECLLKAKDRADSMVVSQTPLIALEREWKEHSIDNLINYIAGQEIGTKSDQLKYITKGKYKEDHILMIGDAMGDMIAARSNNVLFYPINPGQEEDSWEEFLKEGMDRFFSETFQGEYQDKLISKFKAILTSVPPWENRS
jgi:phosphoglycolate phosphatase-like HAD superfamily hydrolase